MKLTDLTSFYSTQVLERVNRDVPPAKKKKQDSR